MKKIGQFTALYFVITMSWAYPWHVIWFHDVYVQLGAITRPEPLMHFGILAILIQAVVLAHLFSFYYQKNKNAIIQGVKFNLIAGLLVYTAMGFATAAKILIEPASTFIIYHTVFQTIQFVLTGIALGWVYGRKKG